MFHTEKRIIPLIMSPPVGVPRPMDNPVGVPRDVWTIACGVAPTRHRGEGDHACPKITLASSPLGLPFAGSF
jgi:hypothetical protein